MLFSCNIDMGYGKNSFDTKITTSLKKKKKKKLKKNGQVPLILLLIYHDWILKIILMKIIWPRKNDASIVTQRVELMSYLWMFDNYKPDDPVLQFCSHICVPVINHRLYRSNMFDLIFWGSKYILTTDFLSFYKTPHNLSQVWHIILKIKIYTEI